MYNAPSCICRDHGKCVHATMRKLLHIIDTVECFEYDDSGLAIAVVGMPENHWRQFVLDTDEPDRYLKGSVFSVTRPNGDAVFVVPVDGLASPKVLTDEDQEALMNNKGRQGSLMHS